MNYFDLHCDTATRIFDSGEQLKTNKFHVALDRAAVYDRFVQTFAIWLNDTLDEKQAMTYFDNVRDCFSNQLAENSSEIDLITGRDDFNSSKHAKAIISVENGKVIGRDLDNINYLYSRDVKLVTLTWNGCNAIGNGSVSGVEAGLTPFGKAAVKRLNDLGMTVDVSHLNDRGFYDVACVSDKPFIASHSNCRALCSHPRNLTDEQIKIICENGGLIGLNLSVNFLADGGIVTWDDVRKHMCRILDLGGENALAVGADYDGTDVPDFLPAVESIAALSDMMKKWGFDAELCEKILYKNSLTYFTNAL